MNPILTIIVDDEGKTHVTSIEGISGEQLLKGLAMNIVAVMEVCDHMVKQNGEGPAEAAVLKQSVMALAEEFLKMGVECEPGDAEPKT